MSGFPCPGACPASGLTNGLPADVLSDGRPGRVPGRVTETGLSRSGCLKPSLPPGFAGLAAFPEGRDTVVLGLRSFEVLSEGREAGCLMTVPEGFEVLGLVTVAFLLFEVVLEVPVVERDSPLRACASAPDSNATKANAARIAANDVLIVLIIVQF